MPRPAARGPANAREGAGRGSEAEPGAFADARLPSGAYDVLQADLDAGLTPCNGLPKSDRIDRCMEGMQQRNKVNRDRVTACAEDLACTSVPIP
ncbi:hypothetical protein ACFC08_35225 [Streptomyces sp. NPDC056112]|uniref:hypothetical protein n=1 Tax=Streptomyces sp. NPDC056112 TaxID=3345715 RepID=UPI0035E14952